MISNSSGPRAGKIDRLRGAITLRPDPEGEVERKKQDKLKKKRQKRSVGPCRKRAI